MTRDEIKAAIADAMHKLWTERYPDEFHEYDLKEMKAEETARAGAALSVIENALGPWEAMAANAKRALAMDELQRLGQEFDAA